MEYSMDWVLEEIARATDLSQLRAIRDHIQEELQGRPLSAHPETDIHTMNHVHDALIRFAGRHTEAMLEAEGFGRPPMPYALLLFGSGGRGEMTMWSDQDNGLIYEDPAPEEAEAAAQYFEVFGQKLVKALEQLGYPPCEGEVLCSNRQWRRSLSNWKAMLRNWMEDQTWENIRYLLIQADSRAVYGKEELCQSLKNELLSYVSTHKDVLGAMLRNTLRRKVSLGVLGNLIPERFGEDMGGIDIKYGAYIPLVNGIRLLAIRHGILQSGTLDRLDAMIKAEQLNKGKAQEWREAFCTILKLRSMTAHRLEDGFYQTSGVLPGAMLTQERKKELKASLRSAKRLHKYVEKEILHMEMEKG